MYRDGIDVVKTYTETERAKRGDAAWLKELANNAVGLGEEAFEAAQECVNVILVSHGHAALFHVAHSAIAVPALVCHGLTVVGCTWRC